MSDNQTPDEWLSANNPSQKGTGLYIKGSGSEKQIVSNVQYLQFLADSEKEQRYAYKWVPHVIASEASVNSAPCGDPCANRCVKPGCICDRGQGICK